MKILLVMDPGITLPVKGYGGIERIIEMLAREYVANGHEVHLLLTTGSEVKGCVVHGIGKEGFPPDRWEAKKAVPVVWRFLWKNRNNFDLVHNFGRLVYLLPLLHHPVKKIMTYQREITRQNISRILALPHKNLWFTGCSQNLVNRAKVRGNWQVVHNSADFRNYTVQEKVEKDAPLIFLGRIEKIKGCHTAIAVARATGRRLIIAGNISTLSEEKEYYEKEIAPNIDGVQVQHIGAVNDGQKNDWLGKAAALLFPIEWEEPFGIVMVEAMACGTPVIAFNRGAVAEVVDEGVTGYKVSDVEEMVAAVGKLSRISRSACRLQALQRFDSRIIARRYLAAFAPKRKKVVLLSTHQPAANPRAVKEYEALKAEGYEVKFMHPFNYQWAYKIDEQKFQQDLLPRQDFICVGGDPYEKPFRHFVSKLRFRLFRFFGFVHPFFRQMANARVAFDLWQAAVKHPTDLYIAHYPGALPGAQRAARRHGARLIFDAEDFHRGEMPLFPQQVKNVLTVEDRTLPCVDGITTASPLISKGYKTLYPQKPVVTINNVFSIRNLQVVTAAGEGELKLFWFSQYIGPHRGLEIVIQALNELAEKEITLTLLGNCQSEKYRQQLKRLAKHPERITFRDAVSPDELFRIAANHDIGLAGEVAGCLNRQLCLTNKIFTYLLAGNCILASDTPAQAEFLQQNTGLGFLYRHDDPNDLAAKMEMLFKDKKLLQACKANARKAGAETHNWEREQHTWLHLVQTVLRENKRENSLDLKTAKHTNPVS